jgi:hypothetical protein
MPASSAAAIISAARRGLVRELHLVEYPGRVAALDIGAPGVLGQVEPAVDQRPPPLGGVGEEHADLAVLDTSCGARVLALYPRRGPALLHKAGLVDDENAAVGPEVFDDVGANVASDGIRVPAGVAQQALHRPGPGVAGLLGQPPAVFVGAGGRPRLNSPESARDLGHDLVEHRPPTDRAYVMARGHRTIFRSSTQPPMITRWP